jgi:hypothetical protein
MLQLAFLPVIVVEPQLELQARHSTPTVPTHPPMGCPMPGAQPLQPAGVYIVLLQVV